MSAQRYASDIAHRRMKNDLCPECGSSPRSHLDSNAFWIPRDCDLTRAGVLDRIKQYRRDVARPIEATS